MSKEWIWGGPGKWGITRCVWSDYERLGELLFNEWEPFAVVQSNVWLRKRTEGISSAAPPPSSGVSDDELKELIGQLGNL